MQSASKRRNPIIRDLELRTEEDWLKAIKKVKPDIRVPVAKIIWWDFFSGRPASNRARGFDIYLNSDITEYPPNKMIGGLITAGYNRDIAEARLSGKGGRIHATNN
jgi:hypothetical protein